MRILHVTDHYPPVLGGIEAHVHALARRQAARGDEVTVLTSTQADADGRHADDTGDVQVHRVVPVVRGGVAEGHRVDTAGFDVVHAHISLVAPFTSPVAARIARRGTPTVVTVHSLWRGMGLPAIAHADGAGLRGAPLTWTAVSRVAARQLGRWLPRRTGIGILANAVDVAARPVTPVSVGDRPVRLVSTMRIARRKRPRQLLGMFAELCRSTDVPVQLTVIGDGPLRPRLEQEAERAGLAERIEVTGRVEPDEVIGRLAQGDLYVAPAVLESFGLAALEARCVGLPVVGHAASGMADFVHDGVDGWLCGSDAGIVERLQLLVEDPLLRWEVSEHNRTTPSPLTWEHALDQHDRVYDQAASRAGARRRPMLLTRGRR